MRKRDSKKLKRSENPYLSIIEQSQDAIYILFKGKFEYFNQKFMETFQITLEEANSPDFNFLNLIAPESRTFIKERLKRVARGEHIEPKYEFTALTKNGKRIIVEASVSYMPYEGGTAAHGILRDITERKRMEEDLRASEERYRLNFENVSDVIYSIDPDLKVLTVSPSVERILGYTPEELIGKHIQEMNMLVSDYVAMAISEILRVFEGERLYSSKYEFITKDGKRKFGEVSSSPVFRDGKVIAVIGVARDITDRIQTEEELKKRENELFIKSHNLEEVNTALKVLLKRRDEDREEFEKKVLSNVKKIIIPYIKKLKNSGLNTDQMTYTKILENNLNEITSPFSRNLSAKYIDFTSQEIQVANYVKEGKTSKDIAKLLNVTKRTVNFHRENIRIKLGLTNNKRNLRSYLLSIP